MEKVDDVRSMLKQKHSDKEYNRIIAKMKSDSRNDSEILAYMSNDKMLSFELRLFAIAAM